MAVDGDEPAFVDRDAGRLGADPVTVGHSTDGHQDPVVDLGLSAGELHLQPALLGRNRDHLGLQVDRLVAPGDPLLQRLDEVSIGSGEQLVEQLDDRDLRAERVVDGRELESDDPAADHEQPLRDVRKLERVGRVDDPRIVRDARQRRGA